jgi:hypothetical protein
MAGRAGLTTCSGLSDYLKWVARRPASKDDAAGADDADGWSWQVTSDPPKRGRERPRGVALGRLRRRCQARLDALGLDLPVPFTIEAFCEDLGRRLGRQIVLCPVDTYTGSCGLWVATDTTDYFFYEGTTTPLHKEVIVGHEAGHLVFGHSSADVMPEELAGLLGLDVALVRHVLGRTSYSTEEEQEAEVFGTVLLEQAVRAAAPARHPASPEDAEVLHRVQAALTGLNDPHGR